MNFGDFPLRLFTPFQKPRIANWGPRARRALTALYARGKKKKKKKKERAFPLARERERESDKELWHFFSSRGPSPEWFETWQLSSEVICAGKVVVVLCGGVGGSARGGDGGWWA